MSRSMTALLLLVVVSLLSGRALGQTALSGTVLVQSYAPTSLAIDSSDTLYVLDGDAGVLQSFSSSGGLINTFSISNPGLSSTATGLTIGPSGTVWVSDPGNARLVSWNAATGALGTIVQNVTTDLFVYDATISQFWVVVVNANVTADGTGLQLTASLSTLSADGTTLTAVSTPASRFVDEDILSLAVDGAGNLLLSSWNVSFVSYGVDSYYEYVDSSLAIKVAPNGTVLQVYVAVAPAWLLYEPLVTAAAVAPNGNVYLLDEDNGVVFQFAANGTLLRVGFNNTGFPVSEPEGVACDSQSNVYVADVLNELVLVFDSNGNFLRSLDASPTSLLRPEALAISASGVFYITTPYTDDIAVLGNDGSQLQVISNAANPLLSFAEGIALDAAGNIYVTSAGFEYVVKLDSQGRPLQFFNVTTPPMNLEYFSHVQVAASGSVYVSDVGNHRVVVFSAMGAVSSYISSNYSTMDPRGLALSSNGSLLAVADMLNQQVVVFNTDSGSIVSTVTSSSSVFTPIDVCWTPSGGLVVTDAGHGLLAVFSSSYQQQQLYSPTPVLGRSPSCGVYNNNLYVTDFDTDRLIVYPQFFGPSNSTSTSGSGSSSSTGATVTTPSSSSGARLPNAASSRIATSGLSYGIVVAAVVSLLVMLLGQ